MPGILHSAPALVGICSTGLVPAVLDVSAQKAWRPMSSAARRTDWTTAVPLLALVVLVTTWWPALPTVLVTLVGLDPIGAVPAAPR